MKLNDHNPFQFRFRLRAGARLWAFPLLALLAMAAPIGARAQTADGEVTAALSVAPARIYAGQTVTLTLTIRAQGVTLGRQFNLDGLPDRGLLELEPFQELPVRHEQVGATTVEVHQFRCRAFARQAGSIELAPTLQYERLTQQRSWLGNTTFQEMRRTPLLPLALQVLALPEAGRPAAFSGAVGQFSFTVDAKPQTAAPGDLVTLTLTVRGDGRMDGMACPPLVSNAHFHAYPPHPLATDNPDLKQFEQIVIPESTNAVSTPAAHFTYFDPEAGAYRTLAGGGVPLTMHVRAGAPVFTPYRPDAQQTVSNATDFSSRTADHGAPAEHRSATWWRATGSNALPMLLRVLAYLSLLACLVHAGVAAVRNLRKRPAAWAWKRSAGLLAAAVVTLSAGKLIERQARNRLADHTLEQAVTARLAPSVDALPLCELPAGTAIQLTETWGDWRKITSSNQRGWVQATSLKHPATPEPLSVPSSHAQ